MTIVRYSIYKFTARTLWHYAVAPEREQSRTEQKTENNNSRQTEQQKLDRQTEKTHAPMLQKEMQTWPHRHVDANRKPIKG